MLSAVRPVGRADLSLFYVALTMVASKNFEIPTQLKEYVLRVLNEAKLVAADVQNVRSTMAPESISIAFDLLAERELLESIDSVAEFDAISPEIADKFLQRVEGINARD